MSDNDKPIPALFATIHFRSERRPDGYTDEDIVELNEAANRRPAADDRTKIPRPTDTGQNRSSRVLSRRFRLAWCEQPARFFRRLLAVVPAIHT